MPFARLHGPAVGRAAVAESAVAITAVRRAAECRVGRGHERDREARVAKRAAQRAVAHRAKRAVHRLRAIAPRAVELAIEREAFALRTNLAAEALRAGELGEHPVAIDLANRAWIARIPVAVGFDRAVVGGGQIALAGAVIDRRVRDLAAPAGDGEQAQRAPHGARVPRVDGDYSTLYCE